MNILHDIRYGVRMLFKQPAFSVAAILVLSLGIGGSTAMFSIVNTLLLKPLLIDHPEQLVGVYSRDAHKPGEYRAFSYPNFADLRDQNSVFSSVTAHNLAMVGLAEGDSSRRTFADIIPANYFSTFGVPLYRGRPFNAAEEQPGSQIPVAIVSYTYWRKKGSDPDLLGKTLQINGRMYTIVGIAAEGFTGSTAMLSPELYLPTGMYESLINGFEGKIRPLAARDNYNLIAIGRLKPGVTLDAANTGLAVTADRLARAYPAENKDQQFMVARLSRLGVSTAPMNDSELTFPSLLLIAMAGVVLLIASLNVANMMLVRATARRREVAVRMALGARRRNIAQQLFTEGLVLSVLGGAAGLLLAYFGANLLLNSMTKLAPVDLAFSGAPDVRVLAATMGFCVLSALVFSIGPARSLSESHIVADIKDGESRESLGRGRFFTRRNLLVAGQIALSLMLLTAAGLFLRSSMQAARVEPGFNIANSVLLEVDPRLAGYDEDHGRQLYRTLLERLRAVPGVESAGMAATVPFGMVNLGRNVEPAEAPVSNSASTKRGLSVSENIVSDGYFKSMGIAVLQGRGFRENEIDPKAAPVAVIDELAAKKLWPKGSVLGQRIRLVPDGGTHAIQEAEVIGVVGDVQENVIGEGIEPHIYLPFGQEYLSDMTIHLAVNRQDPNLLEDLRREVRLVDPKLPVLALRTMRTHLDSSFGLWIVRTAARLFSVFGGTALLLAMVGLYGLRAYTVARRTREIGIRLALGARPSDAQRLILREGLLLTAAGALVGLALSLAIGKVLGSMLYKVSGLDPLVLASSTAMLAAVSLLACYLPALRASRVDPMVALRQE